MFKFVFKKNTFKYKLPNNILCGLRHFFPHVKKREGYKIDAGVIFELKQG